MMSNMVNIIDELKVKRLDEKAIVPTRGSEYAAGWDLYCMEDTVIPPGETVMVSTGFAIELPNGTFGGIFARSGLATKKGLRPANCVGVCDSDYRGAYIVAMHNDSSIPQTLEAGERMAQLIVLPFITFDKITEVDELSETTRNTGGFGSTGTK